MAEQIVGRRRELDALAAFLEALPAGGSALLFEGDAGIGKTALWQEGSRLAREDGMRVLTARATQSELQTSFATVADLFAPVLEETLPRLVPVQRRSLEVAFLIREPDGPPSEARLIATALLSIVRILVEQRPLLFAIDDAQWVDTSSADLLHFVFRRLEGEPVAVLATVRGLPVEAPLELDRAFAGFRRRRVAPLSVGAIHRLLWSRLSLNLPRPLLARVHEATGGNPFFALEVGRALADGTISADGVHVLLPESLRGLVAERLGALPEQVRETLVAVAALGAPSMTLLEPLAPTAVADIELACQQRVLELDGDRIRFTHPLLAPVCYEDMPLHRRCRLHRRLADLNVDPEERARHLAISAAGPDEKIAAELDAAAARARARGAALAAAELAELAIALTPPDAIGATNRRRITAAEHCSYAGDPAKATAMLEEAIDSSPAGPVRGEALYQLGRVRTQSEGIRATESLYLQALAEPGVEIRVRARLLCELADAAAADNRDGSRYAEAGLALAEQAAEPELLVLGLTEVSEMAFARTGCIRHDLLDRGLLIERTASQHRYWRSSARHTLAGLLGRSNRFDEARAMWKQLIAEDYELADPRVVWNLCFLVEMELASGAWDEAARLCEEAMEAGRQTGRELVDLLCQRVLAEIAAFRGEEEWARREMNPRLRQVAERTNGRGPDYPFTHALPLLELACGDAAASWRQVEAWFADLDVLGETLARLAGTVAIEALIAIGDLPTAERLLMLLDDYAAEADTAVRPLAARCRGLLQAAQGEFEPAIVALEAAAADPVPPQQASPFELARTLLALGTVQRKAQRKRAARESLERAAEIFEQLGARIWLENARSELARIGGRVPHKGELSETERRIVELVVAGRRNREVADELSLSPNTVAWNLSKVYRKLGVTSRTELAAQLAASPPV